MIKPYQVVPFSVEKIGRLEEKASTLSLKELKEAYENNKAESDRCLETNKVLNRIIIFKKREAEEDEICKEICGPCQNGDHKRCQLTECDCD